LRLQPFDLAALAGGDEATGLAAPLPTPAAEIPLGLAIRIRTTHVLPVIDTRTATIYGTADVDISGTLDRPVVTGRIELDRGEWVFGGTRYALRSGSIDFTNPLAFDPYFDVLVEARPRTTGQTYLVTIRLAGTLDRIEPSINSDPWLPEAQVISLLLGETPDVGAAEQLARSSPQELQAQALRTAGVAILTSPVSARVGGVVESVTAIDTVQIVPLLGNDATLQQLSPTARVTLGKRISERIYMTYSRTLTGPQNEVILIEFDQSDQVTWVFSRNEDRSFALDFRIRHAFR
jgi:autotransporter translocation and assembly factor TamB